MKEALKLALEALETCCAGDYSTGHVIDPSFDEDAVNEAITAIKEALAQPEQSWSWVCNECGSREFTSAVLEADLEYLACAGCGCNEFHKEALAQPDYRAVKTYHEGKPVYVSQPEQEPVAWEVGVVNGVVTRRLASPTSPPKRPWVGLTDEQREACTQSPFTEDNYDAIEAKLKELNT